jgi:hypothetical protein
MSNAPLIPNSFPLLQASTGAEMLIAAQNPPCDKAETLQAVQ